MSAADVAMQVGASGHWSAAAWAAVGSMAAAIIALGIAARDSVSRWRRQRQRARIYGTSYDLRIGVCWTIVTSALDRVRPSTEIDPTPEKLAEIADWVARADNAFSDQDLERLAASLPHAAEHLAAATACLHIANELVPSIPRQPGETPARLRRRGLTTLKEMLETAESELREAKRICRKRAATKLGLDISH